MIDITTFPHILASINTLTVAVLIGGFYFIKRGDRARHELCMKSAIALAVLFLVVYLYYHANSGLAKFGGDGIIRPIYFSILIAHIIGAVAIVPLVPMLFLHALKQRFDKHRALARWAWPLWLYVSGSGVIVYIMSIHLFPYKG